MASKDQGMGVEQLPSKSKKSRMVPLQPLPDRGEASSRPYDTRANPGDFEGVREERLPPIPKVPEQATALSEQDRLKREETKLAFDFLQKSLDDGMQLVFKHGTMSEILGNLDSLYAFVEENEPDARLEVNSDPRIIDVIHSWRGREGIFGQIIELPAEQGNHVEPEDDVTDSEVEEITEPEAAEADIPGQPLAKLFETPEFDGAARIDRYNFQPGASNDDLIESLTTAEFTSIFADEGSRYAPTDVPGKFWVMHAEGGSTEEYVHLVSQEQAAREQRRQTREEKRATKERLVEERCQEFICYPENYVQVLFVKKLQQGYQELLVTEEKRLETDARKNNTKKKRIDASDRARLQIQSYEILHQDIQQLLAANQLEGHSDQALVRISNILEHLGLPAERILESLGSRTVELLHYLSALEGYLDNAMVETYSVAFFTEVVQIQNHPLSEQENEMFLAGMPESLTDRGRKILLWGKTYDLDSIHQALFDLIDQAAYPKTTYTSQLSDRLLELRRKQYSKLLDAIAKEDEFNEVVNHVLEDIAEAVEASQLLIEMSLSDDLQDVQRLTGEITKIETWLSKNKESDKKDKVREQRKELNRIKKTRANMQTSKERSQRLLSSLLLVNNPQSLFLVAMGQGRIPEGQESLLFNSPLSDFYSAIESAVSYAQDQARHIGDKKKKSEKDNELKETFEANVVRLKQVDLNISNESYKPEFERALSLIPEDVEVTPAEALQYAIQVFGEGVSGDSSEVLSKIEKVFTMPLFVANSSWPEQIMESVNAMSEGVKVNRKLQEDDFKNTLEKLREVIAQLVLEKKVSPKIVAELLDTPRYLARLIENVGKIESNRAEMVAEVYSVYESQASEAFQFPEQAIGWRVPAVDPNDIRHNAEVNKVKMFFHMPPFEGKSTTQVLREVSQPTIVMPRVTPQTEATEELTPEEESLENEDITPETWIKTEFKNGIKNEVDVDSAANLWLQNHPGEKFSIKLALYNSVSDEGLKDYVLATL